MTSDLGSARSGGEFRRRDFLAGAGVLALGLPLLPKAAIAGSLRSRAAPGTAIARVGVYPAIGICRVGGSQHWFLAPEVPGLPPQPDGGFKDGDRLLKKQVQRFRIYAFDEKDQVIGEVTAADSGIEWEVHVANSKAAWYGFNNPLDNGALAPGLPGQKRNQFLVQDDLRGRMLVIDGGPCRIAGSNTNAQGTDATFAMAGRFWESVDVSLGHLRTDEAGRLLVFPSDGVSGSPSGAGITSFADNDGWYDDWCDGPVRARVTLSDGRVLKAEPGWVACVGPNFAPEIPPISTLYDVVGDLNVRQGWSLPPTPPLSFRKHIYPTFRRLALMEWVAASAFMRRDWLDVGDFSDPTHLASLADPDEANAAFRQSIFAKFRDPRDLDAAAYMNEQRRIPYMVGEGVNYDGSPLQWFQFPQLQYDWLAHWANGEFINDLEDVHADSVRTLEDIDVALQPSALTEAALEPCSGGAFHPGVELSYYMRLPDLYERARSEGAEPFRIALGNRPSLIQNVGRLLTPEAALTGADGVPPPIGPQMPGDLTRWMGIPWQCDAFSCQQVVLQDELPAAVWWPALLPVDVLPEANYQQLMRSDLPPEERLRFYNERVPWSRGVAGIGYHANASYWDGITNMIMLWQRMGFVVRRPGPSDPGRPKGIPDQLFVEVGRSNMEKRFNWKPEDGELPK